MNLIVRVLRRLSRPFHLGHIYSNVDGSLYMERFALFSTPWCAARLHHIVREDIDRHQHDHPWDFFSVVLSSGYVEARPFDVEQPVWVGDTEVRTYKTRRAGSIAFRRATDRHQIVAVDEGTWTLFITGPYKNKWGFFVRGPGDTAVKVPYRVYLGLPTKPGQEP